MTQADMILKIMETDGYITPKKALVDIGCMRLASRIHDMKKNYEVIPPIGDMTCHVTNRFGMKTHFSLYYLEGAFRCRKCGKMTVYDAECGYECQYCGHRYVNTSCLISSTFTATLYKDKIEAGII